MHKIILNTNKLCVFLINFYFVNVHQEVWVCTSKKKGSSQKKASRKKQKYYSKKISFKKISQPHQKKYNKVERNETKTSNKIWKRKQTPGPVNDIKLKKKENRKN